MPAFGVHIFCLLLKEYSWVFITLELKILSNFTMPGTVLSGFTCISHTYNPPAVGALLPFYR